MLAVERDAAFSAHVLQQTVVLPDLRVLFLPVPKAGCTSVLWRLAELAGLDAEAFGESTLPEPSAALTVHDLNVWDPGHRLAHHPPEARARLLAEDGWLRFTLVRDPWARLWSGWQSKLLLREPRFLAEFGDRPWFPRVPERPSDLVEDFRRFVAAVGEGEAVDVHWAVQQDLVSQLPLGHVGRVERMGETMALLRTHVGPELWPVHTGRANTSAIPLPPGVYDAAAAGVVTARYAADFDAFGYDPAPPAGAEGDWDGRVAPLIGLIRSVMDVHDRVGQLHRLAQRRGARVQELEARVQRIGARGRGAPSVQANDEENEAYTVRWAWEDGALEPGMTAVVRVRNEARSLPWTLPPLLRAAAHVVLLDNGSTDGTASVARRLARDAGAGDRLEVHGYPFAIARCGGEHLATPSDSVHSLTYFYNWSFSHVRTSYALKWDGDMVLTDAGAAALRDLAWQLEATETVVRVPRLPLYVADAATAFLDLTLRNCEPWAWPNRPGYRFVKALEWELPMFPERVATVTLPDFACVELKHLDADEFAHWSHTDFDASPRTARKRREHEVFGALAAGAEPPDGVVRIDAPRGTHVVDHVRSAWLPERAAA